MSHERDLLAQAMAVLEAQRAVLVGHENACIGCGEYVDVNVNEGRNGDEGAYTHSR